jgi:hypothetical protein
MYHCRVATASAVIPGFVKLFVQRDAQKSSQSPESPRNLSGRKPFQADIMGLPTGSLSLPPMPLATPAAEAYQAHTAVTMPM